MHLHQASYLCDSSLLLLPIVLPPIIPLSFVSESGLGRLIQNSLVVPSPAFVAIAVLVINVLGAFAIPAPTFISWEFCTLLLLLLFLVLILLGGVVLALLASMVFVFIVA